MGDTTFKDLFNEMESGSFTSSIPAGTYDVIVTDARPRAESNLIFLTLQVLEGPAAQKQTEVNLYIPKEGDRPFAFTAFKKKMFGFSAYPDVKSAFEASVNAPTREALLDLFANAITGKTVKADIGLRGADAGQYANTNELNATNRPAGGPAAAAAPVEVAAADNGAAPVTQTAAAPF